MIEQKEVKEIATLLQNWLKNLFVIDEQERLTEVRRIVDAWLEQNCVRKVPELRVVSNRCLALLYPKFESFLLGAIPQSMDLEGESELSVSDASTVLLRDLCKAIESFETNDMIKSAITSVLDSTVSPIKAPNMPFNNADPYMEIDD